MYFQNHECMASLKECIKFMSSKGVYESNTDSPIPQWMIAIREKLQDSNTPTNVRLFLLRLILNCHDEFEPFARYFTFDILKLITSEVFWAGSPIINYFSLDIIVMLLEWSYVPIPNDFGDKHILSNLVEVLAKSASETPSPEIKKHILRIFECVAKYWNKGFVIGHSFFHRFFAHKDDLNKNIVGIQILATLVDNEISPYENTTVPLKTYIKDLANSLDSYKKEVYRACAETLGLCLNYFKENSRLEELEISKNIVEEQLKKLQKQAGAKASEKFFLCLYFCHRHYPEIVEVFAQTFVYGLKQFHEKSEILFHAMTMLKGAIPYFRNNVSSGVSTWPIELGMIGIKNYILGKHCNYPTQLAALDAYNDAAKIFYHQHPDLVQDFIKNLSKLILHPMKEIRQKSNQTLKWMTTKEIPNARDILLSSLNDEDPTIVTSTVNFIKEYLQNEQSSPTISKLESISNLLVDKSEDAFLCLSCELLIGQTEVGGAADLLLFKGKVLKYHENFKYT